MSIHWQSHILHFLKSLVTVEKKSRLKLLLVSLGFMFVIAGYTIVRTLKDALFVAIVGKEYIPIARGWAIIMLIPGVLIFSKLVDVVRRYQLIYIYSLIYGVGGFVIAFLLQHSTMGLVNDIPSKGRLFGWFIYLFIEGYNPFLISVFWSFVNSITSPDEAKVNYPFMVGLSKLGGMVATSAGCYLLSSSVCGGGIAGDILSHQLLLAGASALILLTPICVYALLKNVPQQQLHGYEAAYHAEKLDKKDALTEKTFLGSLYGMFSGFIFLLRYPYALGMFGIVFFWEVINSFVSFERLADGHFSLGERTCLLLRQDFIIHGAGLLIVMIGTRAVVELLGERKSLMLVPLLTGGLLAYYFSATSATSVPIMGLVYVLLRVMNLAFAVPLRERLYTTTSKEIKFKSKLWIDSFGVKLAKGTGSVYNYYVMRLAQGPKATLGLIFFSTLIGLWTVTSHLMGRAFEKSVSQGEVIGLDKK